MKRKLTLQFFSAVSALIFSSCVTATSEYNAKVVGIADGDTITVYDGKNPQAKIRLSAIDAPEKAQAFGEKSKQALSHLCFGQQATVKPITTDRYGRTVADITCQGQDAGAYMVKSGMAWVYVKYAKGYDHLYPLQTEAKATKRGLWFDANPTPPWEWRHGGKTEENSAVKAIESTTDCPCTGQLLCTGPKGGHYCLTDAGKKKYRQ